MRRKELRVRAAARRSSRFRRVVLVLLASASGCGPGPGREPGAVAGRTQPTAEDLPPVPSVGGRAYFRGFAKGPKGDAETLRRAEAMARRRAAEAISTTISASLQDRMRVEMRPGFQYEEQEISSATESSTNVYLTGFRFVEPYHYHEPTGTYYVDGWMPEEELRPTLEYTIRKLEVVSARLMAAGRKADALSALQTLAVVDRRPARRRAVEQCLADMDLREDAATAAGQLALMLKAEAAQEKNREAAQRKMKQAAAAEARAKAYVVPAGPRITWSQAMARMRAAVTGARKPNVLRMSVGGRTFPRFNPDGTSAKIPLSITTSRQVHLTFFWEDADGIYLWRYRLDGVDPGRMRWDGRTRLIGTGTCTGRTALMGVATPERLAVPVDQVLRREFEAGDRTAITRLKALVKYIETLRQREDAAGDVVGFEVTQESESAR